MNPAQLHLALNHLPIAFVLVGLPLLGVALLRKSGELKTAAVILLALSGLSSAGAFLSGEPAEEVIESLSGISEALIHEHETSAKFSLALAVVLGLGALGVWLVERRRLAIHWGFWAALLVLGGMSFATFLRTAHLGGLIRHDEIRGTAAHAPASEGHGEEE